MQKKAFVLLSGGLDSTTALYLATYQFCPQDLAHGYGDPSILHEWLKASGSQMDGCGVDWVEAISIDYGQRHLKETEYAKRTCERLGINHTILPLRQLLEGPGVMLTDTSVKVPDIAYSDIKGVSPTFVPFRNGLMLSAITAHAQKYVNTQIEERTEVSLQESDFQVEENPKGYWTAKARDLCGIYFGAHADDAVNWAYPDCTPEFIGAMANAIYVGTYNTIRLFAPFASLSKGQIVEWGTKIGVPYENTWSCYKGEEFHCGVCPTCRSRKDAFRDARVLDPTTYADRQLRGDYDVR